MPNPSHAPAVALSRRGIARLGAAFLLAATAPMAMIQPALAQTAVRFTLDWRFEGPAALFLMALEKGYFKAEGLDVDDRSRKRLARSDPAGGVGCL
jgi:NitT/TauT family transport system substrate-binding protein